MSRIEAAPKRRLWLWGAFALILVLLVVYCGQKLGQTATLRLATTTSVENSGLLPTILPEFEAQYKVRVDVIAVGTGQALALGERGDVDVVLVHAPELEETFVANGYGLNRYPVATNDFVIAGPAEDPAGIASVPDASTALQRIAEAEVKFASRGDNSGTHVKELALWESAGLTPTPEQSWYLSLGQGMGDTLNFANETLAYTLTDRGTFLSQRANLPNLAVLFGGATPADNPDPALINYYSVIPVNPERHVGINSELAQRFVEWLISVETQEIIGAFGVEEFGQPLFFPNSDLWNEGERSMPSTSLGSGLRLYRSLTIQFGQGVS